MMNRITITHMYKCMSRVAGTAGGGGGRGAAAPLPKVLGGESGGNPEDYNSLKLELQWKRRGGLNNIQYILCDNIT